MSRKNEIPTLRNFGPGSGKLLNQVGIYNLEDLKKADLVDLYLCLKEMGDNVTLNLLWAMVGAVMDLDWREIPTELKNDFKEKISKRKYTIN